MSLPPSLNVITAKAVIQTAAGYKGKNILPRYSLDPRVKPEDDAGDSGRAK